MLYGAEISHVTRAMDLGTYIVPFMSSVVVYKGPKGPWFPVDVHHGCMRYV